MTTRGGFLRDNILLLAAVGLPLVVVALFLVASAVPRWTVPPPAYDLLLRQEGPSDPGRPKVSVEFRVRDRRLEATVRPLPSPAYPQVPRLLLVDHETMNMTEIPFDVPDLTEGDAAVTAAVALLADREVIAQARAPDGYELRAPGYRSTGIVGDLFGMRSRGDRVALVNRGRVVPLPLPSGASGYGITAVGWVLDEASR